MSSINGDVSIDKAALEQKYIDLLEKRIAQLEARLGEDDSKDRKGAATPDTASKTKEDEGNKDGAAKTSNTFDAKESKKEAKNDSSKEPQASEGASRDDAKAKDNTDEKSSTKDNEEKTESEPPSRVKQTLWKYIEDKSTWDDVDYNKSSADASDDKAKQTTIFRYVPDEDSPKKIRLYEIEIFSPGLLRLFTETSPAQVQLDDNQDLDETSRLLTSPFTDFMWYWDKFEAASKPVEGDSEERANAREDLRQLMPLIRQAELEPFFKARDSAIARGVIPYPYLWILFSPGTKVYAKTFIDDVQLLEVISCGTPDSNDGAYDNKSLYVNCLGFDWDGTKFNTFKYTFRIPQQKNEKETTINSLAVYPTSYFRASDGERNDIKQRESLVNRGKTFWNLCGNVGGNFQYQYSGAIHGQLPPASRMAQIRSRERDDDDSASMFSSDMSATPSGKKEYKGSVIIDAYSFLHAQEDTFDEPPLGNLTVNAYYENNCFCQSCRRSPVIYWREQYVEDTKPDVHYAAFADNDDRLMMCPPRVLGYALKLKTWAQFRVQNCIEKAGDSEDKRSYFADQLQLKQDYKDMLLAFVNSHQSSTQSNQPSSGGGKDATPPSLDVIEGKGRGLAILLHGPPGVGKTLTAETIALATGRPLLTVAVAEVGTNAALAEAKLNVFFAIAARWGAILLVDEADVFLEERTRTDNPERNMLVSVLLRCLEYYEGIIFLTTNRIKSIDIAVQSRMHLAIQYKSLDEQSAASIYRGFLDKVPDSKIKGERKRLYRDIEKHLCRRNAMNGRQIRNIVSAALGLAKDREVGSDSEDPGDGRIRFEDLRRVHETTTDFLESLKDTTEKRRRLNEADEV